MLELVELELDDVELDELELDDVDVELEVVLDVVDVPNAVPRETQVGVVPDVAV